MKSSFFAATLAASIVVPSLSYAATVSSVLNYSRDNVGLDGGNSLSFNKFTSVDLGIATLRFGAAASGGDVDASANIGFSTSFSDSVDLADADQVALSMSLNNLNFDYSTYMGAEAGAFVNFKSFLGINLPEFTVIGDDYSLSTSDSRSGFGSTGTERATRKITGVGPDASLGLAVRAEVTLDASQETSFSVSALQGTIVATHEGGTIVTNAFSMVNGADSLLDLSREGNWTLELIDVALRNSFDSATGLSAGYELGLALEAPFFGGSCGDFSRDDDNEFGCGGDTGVSGDTSQLSLINPSPFEIAWGTKSVSLGTISVVAPIAPVPLPAGAPLLLGGVLVMAGFRAARPRPLT